MNKEGDSFEPDEKKPDSSYQGSSKSKTTTGMKYSIAIVIIGVLFTIIAIALYYKFYRHGIRAFGH